MLTPNTLRSDRCQSGYRYVQQVGGQPSRGDSETYFQGIKSVKGKRWVGPGRRSPLEAAQDVCDFVNGQLGAPPATLRTAGHDYVVDEQDRDEEYQAALGVIRDRTAQRREGRQGYVYLIIEVNPGGALTFGKIGYSTNPHKRVAELQTGNPRLLALYAMKPGTEADEAALHAKYIKWNKLQEWFAITKEMLLEWDIEHIVYKPAPLARVA